MRPFGTARVNTPKTKPVGEVRKTQLITTHGPGAIVDFVNDTVMIAGIDHWDWDRKEPGNSHIVNHENLQNLLDVDYFVEPKIDDRRRPFFADKSEDIPAYRFPEMMYCTSCKRLYHWSAFKNRTYNWQKCFCGQETLLASRFVVICENGHIEDFPYFEWVHWGMECPSGKPKESLSMFNIEGRSSIESLVVKCNNCGSVRKMVSAFNQGSLRDIKQCSGNSPWLSTKKGNDCDKQLVTRLRSSSSVYFPAIVSGLSIPPWSAKLFSTLEKHYDILINYRDQHQAIREYIIPSLPNYSEEQIAQALEKLQESKKLRGARTWPDIYYDEYSALTYREERDEEFSSQFVEPPRGFEDYIEKVVAIDSLTEVVAFLGFTRVSPWTGRLNDEKLSPITSKKKNWLPAAKMRGEGIFIQFRTELVEEWAEMVEDYYAPMLKNLHKTWMQNDRASASYIFLHTFAHLLIRQLAVESGYGVASLKERIYSTIPTSPGQETMTMSGILIYTASPDADGSLGGLVEQSLPERLGPLIANMLDEARWCSSDPLCIDSHGDQAQGFASLNYAACYACTLLPETSCEFRNVLLDRAALVGCPENPKMGFFANLSPFY